MTHLAGKVAVVTGASSGIGRAIAERFVAEGATVVVGCRTQPEPGIAGSEWVRTDVANSAQADALIEAAVDAHGRLDVLVNNAGVQLERRLDETSDADYDLVMDVNVRGVFSCCRAAIRAMRAGDGGAIINIGSIAGFQADRDMAVYNASKGAVHALTKAIATDHGADGIRCNAISPGWIATAMADAAFDAHEDPAAARAEAVRRHPVGRLGTPTDVANLATWLAGDEAGFVSGSLFTIDGGLTAQSPI